jgi:hypothetical protein
MPYRDQATVDGWVREFLESDDSTRAEVSVLDKDFTSGPDSGLVVVSLRNASTVTYIQPVIREGAPQWLVTFEARHESFDLDVAGVARLAADLTAIVRLCEHLQSKTDAAIEMMAGGSAR